MEKCNIYDKKVRFGVSRAHEPLSTLATAVARIGTASAEESIQDNWLSLLGLVSLVR